MVEDHFLEDTVEGRIKYAADFLNKEMLKPIHPFSKLCLTYSKLLEYDEIVNFKPKTEK